MRRALQSGEVRLPLGVIFVLGTLSTVKTSPPNFSREGEARLVVRAFHGAAPWDFVVVEIGDGRRTGAQRKVNKIDDLGVALGVAYNRQRCVRAFVGSPHSLDSLAYDAGLAPPIVVFRWKTISKTAYFWHVRTKMRMKC